MSQDDEIVSGELGQAVLAELAQALQHVGQLAKLLGVATASGRGLFSEVVAGRVAVNSVSTDTPESYGWVTLTVGFGLRDGTWIEAESVKVRAGDTITIVPPVSGGSRAGSEVSDDGC